MTDTIAKIRAKGLDATGVTEAIAGDMYRSKGKSYLAIVEMKVEEIHEKSDGQRRVDLTLQMVEPVLDDNAADHVRELTRVLYRNRQQEDGQMAIDESLAPSVEDVLAAGEKHKPHPYLASTLSTEDEPICDVCGLREDVNLHNMPATDPFDIAETEDKDVELAEWEQEVLDQEAAAAEATTDEDADVIPISRA